MLRATTPSHRAAPSIMRCDSHAIAAADAAPSARVVLGRIVKEGSASWVGASLNERGLSSAEQIARRPRDWNQQLIGLVEIQTGLFLEASRAPREQHAAGALSNRSVDRVD